MRATARAGGSITRGVRLALTVAVVACTITAPRAQATWNAAAVEAETLQHFQALLRIDTSSPPGNEIRAVEYLKKVLDGEGIPNQIFAKDPMRPNLVARITGNGRKRPILVMGHTDVVTVDPAKWTHPPFGAARQGGYVYGRGAVDDKDNVVAGLMLVLTLKRTKAALDRDVIFLAESGEEGAPEVGAQFMIDNHLDAINAEYCFAEGGSLIRTGGVIRRANIGTTEKEPRFVELIARGAAGHGSVPSRTNAITRLSIAVGKLAAWSPPLRLNDTTRAYFTKLATVSSPEEAGHYRAVLSADVKISAPAAAWLLEHQPQHWSMLHTSLVPTIIGGGFRYNVIPSEAKATIDVRLHPQEDQATFLDTLRRVIDDAAVEVRWGRDRYRPAGESRIDTEAFRMLEAQVTQHYDAMVFPTMGTGATDMAQIRSKGIQCYGIGPAIDSEDGPKGFGSHSDQERILERELHRFVRFQYDVVMELARAR